MEVPATSGRSVSLSHSPSRQEWRVAENEELERSNLGQPDERTIYELGQEAADAANYGSIRIEGIMGIDDRFLQQRVQSLARERAELQQMENELRAQMIAKSEIMEIHNEFDARLNDQANVSARLQDQLPEREQTIHELERRMEEKERELHAVRLETEAAWAKEDLLREQNKELANFRRELDSIEAERAHHIKQLHDLQEHLQDKERQLVELQEQNRATQETILYKDEQIRDAQSWMTRVQEIDVLQASTLQAELRKRTEQYNQLWLGCQRQFAEMERLHMQAIQRLQLELAGVSRKSGTYITESSLSQNSSNDRFNVESTSGNYLQANGYGMANCAPVSLPNGNSDNAQILVSSGNASTQLTQTNHVPTLPVTTPSILGTPSYLPPEQVTALHSYVMHQQGSNHSVPSHVSQFNVSHFHSVPTMASFQEWENQQAVSEGPPVSSQYQYMQCQSEENPSRSESNYSYGLSSNGSGLHPDYQFADMNKVLDPNSRISSAVAQAVEYMEKNYVVAPETQYSLQQIYSRFHEALHLEPHNQTGEIKAQENNSIDVADNNVPESRELATEQRSSVANPAPSEASGHPLNFTEATMNNAADAVLSEAFVSAGQANSLSTGKRREAALLDQRTLLACIVRTVPAGGKICISSTLPNRLGKMLAPLHWHDYKMKYGKSDDFVASHPELFLIEGDFIQLREGAQGIIAATSAVAKVAAAAAAASSPFLSIFPSVAVTPVAQGARVQNFSSLESKPVRNSNMKILSKSKDPSELNGADIRPGQPLLVPAQNGLHSGRSVLVNP